MVQLKKKKSLTKLVGYGREALPENLVIEGIISDPEKMAKLIKEMMSKVKEGKFTAEKVVASIPDANVFTRVLELPKNLSGKELKEAVYWEADQSIPMAVTDLVIDWQVLGPSHGKKDMNDVLLVAAPTSIINSYVQLIQALNLQPEALEISLASVIRALVSNKDKDETILVADIGQKFTNFGFYEHALKMSDTLEVGGDNFTDAISNVMGLDGAKAEKLKISSGLKDKKVEGAIKPALASLRDEMQKIIKYHDERFEEKTAKVILCGGSSNLIGLTEFLTDSLGIQVKIGNPWVNIDTYPLKPVPRAESAAYASAIGLSLRAMEAGK